MREDRSEVHRLPSSRPPIQAVIAWPAGGGGQRRSQPDRGGGRGPRTSRSTRRGTSWSSKSTVPPGTCERVERVIGLERPGLRAVVSSPEILRGSRFGTPLGPDRMVVRASTDRAYRPGQERLRPMLAEGASDRDGSAPAGSPSSHRTRSWPRRSVYANAIAGASAALTGCRRQQRGRDHGSGPPDQTVVPPMRGSVTVGTACRRMSNRSGGSRSRAVTSSTCSRRSSA